MTSAPIRSDLTAEYVRSILSFDPEAGTFTWSVRRSRQAQVGRRAGYVRRDGYREIMIDGHSYLEHRLAWLVIYGSWPVLDVDHIDGMKFNNAQGNLRQATRVENCRNVERRGYTYFKDRSKFRACIWLNGKNVHLGFHDTREQAHAAYLAASALHFGDFSVVNRGVLS